MNVTRESGLSAVVKNVAEKEGGSRTGDFYDRIAEVHNFALQINGYKRSVAKYLRATDAAIDSSSYVLDAGSGTGIITLGLYLSGLDPKRTITLDLSHKSLRVARRQFVRDKRTPDEKVSPVMGNVLFLPFGDDTFDLVLSCGVLEYVPVGEGLAEFARVLRPGGKLVLIPVKPSFVGSVLKFLYKFRIHTAEVIKTSASPHFNIIDNYRFPFTETMGWSKTAFLLQKKG